MKRLMKFLKPYKILLVIGPIFKLTEAILELMLPYFMSKIIDIGVANQDKNYVMKMGALMMLIALIGICSALICQYVASLVSQGVGTDMRNELFAHIASFSNAELDRFGTASLVNRITNDVNQIQLAVAMLIRLVIRAPFLCIGGFVMAVIIDVKLSLVLLGAIPIFTIILVICMRKTVPLYRMVQKKLDQIALVLRENLSGVRVIRAFSKGEYEKKRFDRYNKEYEENTIRVGRIAALMNPLTSMVLNLSIGIIIWAGGVQVYYGETTTGEIIAFIGYVALILSALIVISQLVVIYTKAFASAGRILEVLETEPSIIDDKESKLEGREVHNPEELEKEENRGNRDNIGNNENRENSSIYAVEFCKVSMTYEKDAEYDVENIDFKVKRGETIGIIGGTGSGKTTVINLIPRFYDVSDGCVMVNGKDVRSYNTEELRSKIGVVPQDTTLFTGSIADNIRFGKNDATESDIRQAADISQAAEFIDRLPEGYDTQIVRGGMNVSGGQRQRLTIARALVKKPEILILDDSFRALDFVTDAALRKALKVYTENMTTFIVSQRVSTIQSADKIVVLNEGKIVGLGNHDELLQDCVVYREILDSQRRQDEGGVA